MPSPEATPPLWVALLDSHIRVAKAYGLGFAVLARPDTELL